MSEMRVSLVIEAINRATRPIRDASRAVGGFMGDVNRLNRAIESNMQRRNALRGQLMDVVALGASLAGPMKAAIDFESAMADVSKVVDFKTPDGLKAMERAIKQMSREIPVSADGLAAIVASGGQLGIAEKNLTTFARTAAKMAVAFEMAPNEAGHAMAKLSNVLSIPIPRVGELGDAINHLSDNTAAKAPEIVQALLRVGGVAKGFGISAVETAALADAFIALGKPPEVAGTAINSMLLTLQTASTEGKAFQEVLRYMGLSAKGLEKAIGEDAQAALSGFLQRLSELNKSDRAKATKMLFGGEYADDIALLVGSLGKYRQALDLVGDRQKYAGSMTREFENRSKTTANNLRLLRNSIEEVGINIGSTLLPAFNDLIGVVRGVTTGIADFADQFPVVTKVVSMAAAVMIGGRIAAIGLGYAYTFLKGGVLAAAKGIQVAIGAVRALSIAMAANPIGAVVAVLASAAVLIIANWEEVSAFFRNLWAEVRKAFDKGFVDGILALLRNFDPTYLIAKGINAMVKYLTGVDLEAIGNAMIGSLWDGMKGVASAMEAALPEDFKAVWTKIKGGFDDGFIRGVLNVLENFSVTAPIAKAVNELVAYIDAINLADVGRRMVGSLIDGFNESLAEIKASWLALKSFFASSPAAAPAGRAKPVSPVRLGPPVGSVLPVGPRVIPVRVIHASVGDTAATPAAPAQRMEGAITVRFEGAPPGTRVTRVESRHRDLDIDVDAGPVMVTP